MGPLSPGRQQRHLRRGQDGEQRGTWAVRGRGRPGTSGRLGPEQVTVTVGPLGTSCALLASNIYFSGFWCVQWVIQPSLLSNSIRPHHPKKKPYTCQQSLPPPAGNLPSASCLWICLFWAFHVSGVTRPAALCAWLLSPNLSSRPPRRCGGAPALLTAE